MEEKTEEREQSCAACRRLLPDESLESRLMDWPAGAAVLDSPTMAKDWEPRVQSAEEKLNRHAERIATVEGRLAVPAAEKKSRLTWPNVLVGTLLLAVLYYWAWVGNSIVGIREDLSGLKTTVGRLQKTQAANTLDSANQLAKSGNITAATERVEEVSELLQSAARQEVPASGTYFEHAFQALNELSTTAVDRAALNQAMTQLAEYRSALLAPPALPKKTVTISGEMTTDQVAEQFAEAGIGTYRAGKPDTQFLGHPPNKPGGTVRGGIFIGGRQNLEGLTLVNTTFVRTSISYEGTLPARLENVKFIQCTFNVPSRRAPDPLLEYAALMQKDAVLTP